MCTGVEHAFDVIMVTARNTGQGNTTGISDDTRVEILSGITLEDLVVIGPYRSLDRLKEDTKLEVKEDKDETEEEDPTQDESTDEVLARSDPVE